MVVRSGENTSPPGPSRPSLASAVLATFGTQLVVAVLSLVNVIIIGRALGATGRGDVAFLTTIAMLTSNLSLFGLQESNANLAGAEPNSRRALATNSLLLAALFGAAGAGAVAGLAALFPGITGEVSPSLRWIALVAIPILIFQYYLEYLVRADYAVRLANAAWLLAPITNVTVNGLLAGLGVLSVGTAVGTWVIGQSLATALLVWTVSRRLAGFGRPDLALARRSLGFGVKAHPGRVLTLGNYRLDQWLLGALGGSRELGLYSVAVAWAEALYYLPTALTRVQRPDLVRLSRQEAARQAEAACRAALLITIPLALGLIVLAPFLCVTIIGSDFGGSVDDLRVLAFGAFGIVLLKLLGNALTARGLPVRASAGVAVAFAATIALDLVLIPRYGGLGAAAASAAAYLLGGAVMTVIFARALGGSMTSLVPRVGDGVGVARALSRLARRVS